MRNPGLFHSATYEAKGFLPLLKSGVCSLEEIRQSIAPGPHSDAHTKQFRQEVLKQFDMLVLGGRARKGEQLRKNVTTELARSVGASLSTLQKKRSCRKRAPREIRKQQIRDAIAAGKRQAEISRELGVDVKTVRRLQRAAGIPPKRFFTPEQRAQIEQGIRAGRSNVELAREFQCDRTRVWQIGREQRSSGLTV
jgi:hypothetical protein